MILGYSSSEKEIKEKSVNYFLPSRLGGLACGVFWRESAIFFIFKKFIHKSNEFLIVKSV